MNEFKFNCSACGQHILAEAQWIGRRITCPSCKTEIQIPSPTSLQKPLVQKDAPTAGQPIVPRRTTTEAIEKRPRKSETTLIPRSTDSASRGDENRASNRAKPGTEVSTAPAGPIRVAVLTPEVKLEMVRVVRRQIANESSWLRGIQEGKRAYAAKQERGKTVLVDVKSPEASRFSLVGAFLIELERRNVAKAAPGRRRLLDQEIPDAIREVLWEGMSEEEREDNPEAMENLKLESLLSISHSQCLATLDVLEDRYSQRMSQAQAERAKRKLGMCGSRILSVSWRRRAMPRKTSPRRCITN